MARRFLLVVFLALAWAAWAPPALATDFTVTSTVDAPDDNLGDGVCRAVVGPNGQQACTLRAAIQQAHTTFASHTISLPAGTFTLTLTGADEDRAATGDLDLGNGESGVRITGAGAGATIVDGNGTDRVFDVRQGGSLTLRALTVRNGFASNHGGGIRNDGSLVVEDAVITGNRARFGVGGIYNTALASVNRTSVADNAQTEPGGGGGGLESRRVQGATNPLQLRVENSTISGNENQYGSGAISSSVGMLIVYNSTISDNRVRNGGDSVRLFNGSQGTFSNVTIANSTPLASLTLGCPNGVACNSRADVKNSVFLSAATAPNCRTEASTQIVSGGGNVENGDTCGFTRTGDQRHADPKLGPLADNGGPTKTHALLRGSPAIDRGLNDGCPQTDQRGQPRPRDGDRNVTPTCDVGAFELSESYQYQTDLSVALTATPSTVAPGGDVTYTIEVANAGPDTAEAVSLEANVAGDATFRSVSSANGWSCTTPAVGAKGLVRCTTPNQAAGLKATLTLVLRAGAGAGGTTLELTATAANAAPDTNVGNNQRKATTTVTGAPPSLPPTIPPATPNCTPRPAIKVDTFRDGTTLRVTVKVASTTGVPSNRLQSIQFGDATNALIDAGTQSGMRGRFTHTPASPTDQVTFTVRRATAGLATTVPIEVVDACGAWHSFVGGGANAF